MYGNFIVNVGGVLVKDVFDFIDYVKKIICEKYEIDMYIEVEIIGENCWFKFWLKLFIWYIVSKW